MNASAKIIVLLYFAVACISSFGQTGKKNEFIRHHGDYSFSTHIISLEDSPLFKSPDLDTTEWIFHSNNDYQWSELLLNHEGAFWVRFQIKLDEVYDWMPKLHIGAEAPFTLYWEGEELEGIRSNNTPSDFHSAQFLLPQEGIQPGAYSIAMRFENKPSTNSLINFVGFRNIPLYRMLPQDQWRIKQGDNLIWKQANYNDLQWKRLTPDSSVFRVKSFDDIPDGIFWIRTGLIITRQIAATPSILLYCDFQGAREIYWDGVLISQNGTPGANAQDEIPGVKSKWTDMPIELLTPGYHQIAVRASSNFPKFIIEPLINKFQLRDTASFRSSITRNSNHYAINLGFSIAVFGFFLIVFFFTERKLSYLLFGLLSGCVAIIELIDRHMLLYKLEIQYNQYPYFYYILVLTVFSISILLPTFTLSHFSFSKIWIWVMAILPLSCASIFLSENVDDKIQFSVLSGGVPALAITLWATAKKKPSSIIILLGTVTCIGTFIIPQLHGYREGGYMIYVVSILIPLTIQIGKRQIEHQQALTHKAKLEVTKSRLEAELIKSCIQPHFLMNTLNALIDWVEDDPKKGVDFIHQISRHFSILLKVSNTEKIPLKQEIELCRSFLSIMSYRKDIQYSLNVNDINFDQLIPPCTLHTLVENAITHNEYEGKTVVFSFSAKIENRRIIYTLSTPLGINYRNVSSVGKDQRIGNGTGHKYVKSQLEENYPENWSFHSETMDTNWVTRIEIAEDTESK